MRPTQASGPDLSPSSPSSWLDAVRKNVLGDSIPERSRLTPELHQWIAEYRPQVIYTILGGNGMMSLIERIRSRFHLPLVVHIMDDWSATAHRHGIFASIERFRMNRWLNHFFTVADNCLGISSAMCEAYAKRYRRPFTAFQYTLDVDRWCTITQRNLNTAQSPEFLYIGSIFPDAQLQSLIDCAQAVSELNHEGYNCRLRIVTSARNITRYRHLLELNSTITMSISDADEAAFFRMLAAADALLLPVNFDNNSVDFIRYSMPTKVPSYLVAGTPCLVYGSGETAQVRYALDSGWGHVITQRSMPMLKEGLRRIATDMPLRQRLSEAAHRAAVNHDVKRVRTAFQDVLCETAAKSDSRIGEQT
jgi:glycosyltransferase involved in cell wall biosynthesis